MKKMIGIGLGIFAGIVCVGFAAFGAEKDPGCILRDGSYGEVIPISWTNLGGA